LYKISKIDYLLFLEYPKEISLKEYNK